MPSFTERLFTAGCRLCAVVVTVVPLAAIGVLLWTAIGALSKHGSAGVGSVAATAGFTVLVASAAAAVGGSFGIGAAIVAEELAPPAVRRTIQTAIAFLGAMPAVAFGWVAVAFVAPVVVREPLGNVTQFVAASLVLAAMIAPTACALVTQALRRLPDAVRQAAAAVGASRLQTTALIVIPAFRNRIGLAVLAGFARAIGEATAMQLFFAALAGQGVAAAATTASWIFATMVGGPGEHVAAAAISALALVVVAGGCGFFVSREYRGMQWA